MAAPSPAPATDSPVSGGGSGSAKNLDFSDIANWDYRTGFFPLTDASEALQQWFNLFPEDSDLAKPRYYFAVAILLYMRDPCTQEEEGAFERLNSSWQVWYDGDQISYEALLKGQPSAPPRYAYNDDEIKF